MWAWGQPLCDFKNVQQRLPAPVMLTSASKVTKVAAGAFHNMAMQEDGAHTPLRRLAAGAETTRETNDNF